MRRTLLFLAIASMAAPLLAAENLAFLVGERHGKGTLETVARIYGQRPVKSSLSVKATINLRPAVRTDDGRVLMATGFLHLQGGGRSESIELEFNPMREGPGEGYFTARTKAPFLRPGDNVFNRWHRLIPMQIDGDARTLHLEVDHFPRGVLGPRSVDLRKIALRFGPGGWHVRIVLFLDSPDILFEPDLTQTLTLDFEE